MKYSKGCPACLAPKATKETVETYRDLASGVPDENVRGAMVRLVELLALFLETPESTMDPDVVPVMIGQKDGRPITAVDCRPLEDAEANRIHDAVPVQYELDVMGMLFDSLTGPTRDAAYHLLWYARELERGREPMTNESV